MMNKQPLIGVTSHLNTEETYQTVNVEFMNSLLAAGALPVLLPLTGDESELQGYVDRLDGFLFSGGVDVDPLLFGEAQLPCCGEISPIRDRNELTLARLALAAGKPMLGICRGMQVLNVALGGTVYQDLTAQFGEGLLGHRQKQKAQYASHSVAVAEGTLLHRLTGQTQLQVNSLHHQAVREMGAWRQCAVAPDGVIEAAEGEGHPFLLGLQWHPERLWRTDSAEFAIFRGFVEACRN